MSEDWIARLKAAYNAGYYRTEAAEEEQSGFPWQNKTCGDCPFWLNGVCRVNAVTRPAEADTCTYFDSANHAEATRIIEERMREVRKRFWEGRRQ